MTDNDWIKQLQSMMERHEEPVGDDLWQDIEARLPERETPSRPMPTWRRYAAAAAVALAVLGTGSLLWNAGDDMSVNENEPVIASSQPEVTTPEPEATPGVLAQNDNTAPAVDNNKAVAHAPNSSVRPVKAATAPDKASDAIAQVIGPTEENAAPVTVDSEPVNQDKEQDQQPSHELNNHGPFNTTTPANTLANTSGKAIITPGKQRVPMTIGLFASNNFQTEGFSNKNYVYFDSEYNLCSSKYSLFYQMSGEYIPVEIFTAKHHVPISVGLSVQYPLNNRLALTSGLVYTRLKSDFTSASRRREQTLHYLGIPVGVSYSLWHYKRLTVYAIGGAQADFNVKATLKESTRTSDQDIGKDRVQFSALVGPGLHLQLSQGFGLYAEPTVRYYFNNGSDLENYFKDKPWNINLNAGLRFTLP